MFLTDHTFNKIGIFSLGTVTEYKKLEYYPVKIFLNKIFFFSKTNYSMLKRNFNIHKLKRIAKEK